MTAEPDELLRRARAWHRTRDPHALWPGVDPNALQPAADAIGRVATARLRGDRATLPGDDPRALGIAAMLTGLGPLVAYWIERGDVDAPVATRDVFAEHLAHGRARIARMRDGIRPALRALELAGVWAVVIKGMHTAHAYFPEPGTRPVADVDLVVAPREVAAAENALRAVGFTASPRVREPYKRDWYPPDDDPRLHSLERFDARERWKLELHGGATFDHLAGPPLALLDGASATERWHGLGVPVLVPAPPALVALLAVHASGELYARRLLRLLELALLIDRERRDGRLAWRDVEEVLIRASAMRFAFPAFALLDRLAPGAVDADLLRRAARASTAFARHVAERFTPTAPLLDDRVALAERLMWTRGIGGALLQMARWALPPSGDDWRDGLGLYHGRLRRLLAGRVSWRAPSDAR